MEEGYLRVLHRDSKGKSVQEFCGLTEKGLADVLHQASPKQVLEELVHTLQARQTLVAELVTAARQWETGLGALQAAVEKVLQQIQSSSAAVLPAATVGPAPSLNGSQTFMPDLLACLSQWQAAGAPGDCPLPELYRRVSPMAESLTIGYFHDNLRPITRAGQDLSAPLDRPALRNPRAGLRPACWARDRLLRQHTKAVSRAFQPDV